MAIGSMVMLWGCSSSSHGQKSALTYEVWSAPEGWYERVDASLQRLGLYEDVEYLVIVEDEGVRDGVPFIEFDVRENGEDFAPVVRRCKLMEDGRLYRDTFEAFDHDDERWALVD
ncbi:MAG: hypothetical protein ACIAQF_06635 [Phycisphaerales bacterium JB065]